MRNTPQSEPLDGSERSDEVLMAAYQNGEESALAELVRRYANLLLGYLTRMNLVQQQAEDVFQETFLRVHTKARSFRTEGRFKPWLFAIATNLALDTLRRQRRRPPPLSLDAEDAQHRSLMDRVPDRGPDPAEAAARADQRARVRRALEALPPRQRATVTLAYFEGLSYPEAAAALGCSVGTVKKQMSRALRTLARLLPDANPETIGGGAR
ncbi:MAG: sigma-70 family RNA polymerase sigma factor [Verrucomicrobiota bacterium]